MPRTAEEKHTEVILRSAELQRETQTLAQRFLTRQKSYESDSERLRFETEYREVVRYCRPDLSPDLRRGSTKRGERRAAFKGSYTSKPFVDIVRSSEAFVGNVFSTEGWFGMRMFQRELNDIDSIQRYTQKLEDHFAGVYNDSNFMSMMPNIAMDLLSHGEPLAYCGNDLDERLPYFQYCEVLATWIQRDRHGFLSSVHRAICKTAGEAYHQWGTKCSDRIIHEAENGRPNEPHWFLHTVCRRTDPILKTVKKLERERPFIEFYFEFESARNQGEGKQQSPEWYFSGVLEQGGYHQMPYFEWPYALKSYEAYARGPMMNSLVSLKRVHGEHKAMSLLSQRTAAPPMKAFRIQQGRIRLRPDGISIMEHPDSMLESVYGGAASYPLPENHLEREEAVLEEAIHLSTFLSMHLATKQMTVPEVMERMGERAAQLMPRLGMGQRYFLTPIHARVWAIEESYGRLPEPPEELLQAAAQGLVDPSVSVIYQGPLSRAQEQMFISRRVSIPLGVAAQLSEFDPQAVTNAMDVGAATEKTLDESGFWHEGIRSKEDRRAREEMQLQLAANQVALEAGEKESKIVQNTATGVSKLGKK